MHKKVKFYSFLVLFHKLGSKNSPQFVYNDLISRYSESHRKYHTLDHIKSCLDEFKQVKTFSQDPLAIEFAIWFHDAVYNTHRKDNEEKSAKLAIKVIKKLKLPKKYISKVTSLILATKHDTEPIDNDEKLICDIDLSSLGLPDDEYEQNSLKIRQEYNWVAKDQYILGRSKVITSFLNKPSIFYTEYFKNKYEKQARHNLLNELERLPYTRG